MTWLISKIVGNPSVLIVLVISTFLVGVSAGGSASWYVQGLRITAAKQAHTQYVQEQTQKRQEAIDAANLQRDKADKAYQLAAQQLADSIAAGDVFRRCVAAGKCGVRQPTCATGIRLPTAIRPDETRADAVSLSAEPAKTLASEPDETLANDCAVTTLMLNSLQSDIEAQPGY